MITRSTDISPVNFSVAVYRFLLAAYPKDFRQEYGSHMLQVFRDLSLRAYGRNGSDGIFRLWAVTLFDLIKSVVEEHLHKETNMNNSTFIRISGWAMILGAIAFAMLFSVWYLDENNPMLHIADTPYSTISYVYGLYVAPFLLSVGLFGLRARFGRAVGSAGRSILLAGAVVGPVISLIGILGTPSNDNLWIFLMYGPAVSMFSLALFGFSAMSNKPLPRMNWLPVLAGIVFPVLVVLGLVLGIFSNFEWYTAAALAVQFLAMVFLGFELQANLPQQDSMAAA